MKAYYEDSAVVIYHGDCREILPTLAKVDLVLTDPPYGIALDSGWLTALHIQRGKPANRSDDLIVGDDSTPDLVFLSAFPRRIVFGFPYLKDSAATGWLVWDKQPGLDSERTLGNPVEMAYTTLWSGFRVMRCLWAGYYRDCQEIRFAHPTQKPIRLIKRLIEYATGTVLDPFMGSGTTLRAAKDLGRKAIGIEIEERYCEIAARRMEQEVLPLNAVQEAPVAEELALAI